MTKEKQISRLQMVQFANLTLYVAVSNGSETNDIKLSGKFVQALINISLQNGR